MKSQSPMSLQIQKWRQFIDFIFSVPTTQVISGVDDEDKGVRESTTDTLVGEFIIVSDFIFTDIWLHLY